MQAEFKELNGIPGYYIDDDIQWHNGKDYNRYCNHFDNVFSSLFPPNKVNNEFRHILVVGGGDMQLMANTTMLAGHCRTKLVDPMVHTYQEMLLANKDNISKYIFNSQRFAYLETSFTEFIPTTIQEFLENGKFKDETFDFIVMDLIDGLAVDEDNEFTSKVWDRLRPGGFMIGYGGYSLQGFLNSSIIPMLNISNIVVEERKYSSWGEDKNTGVVYGVIKNSD